MRGDDPNTRLLFRISVTRNLIATVAFIISAAIKG